MFRDDTFEASPFTLFNDAEKLNFVQKVLDGEDISDALAEQKSQTAQAARAAIEASKFVFARPTDGGADGPGYANPALFIDGDDAGDIVEGSGLANGWFLGALGAIAAHPLALVQNIFVHDDADQILMRQGQVTCRFYVEGEWQEVQVDTILPMTKAEEKTASDSQLVAAYGRCRNPEELWVQMIQKAYAKIHGSYEVLSNGSVADALVDLTGGSAQTILFTQDAVQEMIDSGELWTRIQRYLDWYYVLACSKTAGGPDAVDGEPDEITGILQNRAYSIICAKEVGALRFIKIRNPWGRHADWRGEWSDESPKWDEHPEVEQAMKEDMDINFDRAYRDGTFWIVWEDFVRQFDTIDMCRLFGEEFNQYLIQGEWKGASAAGAHISTRPSAKGGRSRSGGKSGAAGKKSEGKVDRRVCEVARPDTRRGTYVQTDGDPRWFNNPQYRLTVDKETNCYISLSQRDVKLQGGEGDAHFFSDFVVIKQRRSDGRRVWEQVADDVVACSSDSRFQTILPTREVCKAKVTLSPKYAYIVVPYTSKWGVELPYTMRIFTQGEIGVEALPELYSQTFEGSWCKEKGGITSSGGPLRSKGSHRSNPRWTQNPQYLLHIPTSNRGVTLKVVVRRTDKTGVVKGKREGKRNYVGLVVTKPDPPHADGKKRRRVPTNFMGEPLSPQHRAASGKQGEGKRAGGTGDFGPMRDVGRKLFVNDSEWTVISEYNDHDTAAVLLPDVRMAWCENGLLITPTLLQVDLEGSYMFQVFSDHEFRLRELGQGGVRSLPGAWSEGQCGGCHMNPDWKRNPKFHLTLNATEPSLVKITLTRPEHIWLKKCFKDDAVDAMMGFYLMAGTKVSKDPTGIYHEGQPWTNSGFMPVHVVSTPNYFYLEPLPEGEVYTIMPATYNAGKTGPFYLTVEAQCDFSIQPK